MLRCAVCIAVTLSVAADAAAGERTRADVLIKKDGTRLDGEITEGKDTVTVRPKRGMSTRVPREEVKRILWASKNIVHRFLADPNAKDLLILASRAGVRMTLEKAELSVAALKTEAALKSVEKGEKHPDDLAAAEAFLEKARLLPKHTAEAVEKNVAKFEKEFGVKRYESNHYFVLTDLGEVFARKAGARMDGIFREYENRLVFKEKIKDRFVVKIYSTRMTYIAHGAPPQSAAYFSPTGRELVGYKQEREELTWRSLYHEGMHQFLHFHIPNPPIWFDEGLAKYFENATPMRGVRRAGVPSYKAGGKDIYLTYSVKRAARTGSLVSLKRLIGMSKEQFYTLNPQLNYSQAWAFTHFLIESGNPMLKKFWTDYFFALRDGADQEEVNKKVFGKVNWALLERMFKTYVDRL